MRRTVVAMMLAAGCGSPPSGLAEQDAAPVSDAAPPDAGFVSVSGPSFVLDDLHIAGTMEEGHALSLMGGLINPQLEQQIADGTMLIGVELRELDDPSGQSDDAVAVGLWTLQDPDGDPSDNFNPASPETLVIDPAGIPGPDPLFYFPDASITGGQLIGQGVPLIDLLGLLLSIPSPELEGQLVAGGGGERIDELYAGRLRLGLPAKLLALLPNQTGEACAGATMLDLLATGCGIIPVQPDLDLDDDGLETFHDNDKDGSIDRCVDGDGSEILGTDCVNDGAIADGYRVILVLHGVRADLVRDSAN